MAEVLKDDFKARAPISQVPARWFNRVAQMLNGLLGIDGIIVNKDGAKTAAVTIGIDQMKIRSLIGVPDIAPNAASQSSGSGDTAAQVAAKFAPKVAKGTGNAESEPTESVADMIARIGTAKAVARADHQHRLPLIHEEDQTATDMITCEESSLTGGHVLTFYPPKFDKEGRYIGLSDTAAWSVDLLDNVF